MYCCVRLSIYNIILFISKAISAMEEGYWSKMCFLLFYVKGLLQTASLSKRIISGLRSRDDPQNARYCYCCSITSQDGARSAFFQNCCVVLRIVCFLSFYVLFVCKCVLYFCHRVTTQLQLTNILYHII